MKDDNAKMIGMAVFWFGIGVLMVGTTETSGGYFFAVGCFIAAPIFAYLGLVMK